jgi:hypothetical protein
VKNLDYVESSPNPQIRRACGFESTTEITERTEKVPAVELCPTA